MIGYLEGRIVNKTGHTVTIVVGGVGYEVFLTENRIVKINLGEKGSFYTHTHVREDTLSLFGFDSPGELDFFRMLLSVSGIGPKVALSIVASAPIENLKSSISAGDSSLLSSVSGVGKRTAEKAVIELKNKLGFSEYAGSSGRLGSQTEEIIQALSGLGFQRSETIEGIKNIPTEIESIDEKIKYLVKNLGKN
ncbi:MAG: Holliday junction branch migration protein RuvA [Patescibacteria group bacterium]|nr:Holliday junction branch migration protein RuvA [Patescibacteria group bacterium]